MQMIHAYDKVYLDRAQTALGRMLDFAVYDLGYKIEDFFSLFLSSGVASRFEVGDFTLLAGKSGVELAYEVLERSAGQPARTAPKYAMERSEEYWVGWALAYYQWRTALHFSEIVRYVPLSEIQALYSPYHEMDIRQFADRMDEFYRATKPETNLKLRRTQAGLSQKELAELADIPVRTVQQYEQRQKSINKAQAEYLVRLAGVLGCKAEELLDRVE